MKDKILYLIIGILIGAILTTGVFMIINKNNGRSSSNGQNFNRGSGPIMNGEPPTQEEIDAMERTVMEDGSIRYQSPDGGMMIQRRDLNNGGPSGEARNQ